MDTVSDTIFEANVLLQLIVLYPNLEQEWKSLAKIIEDGRIWVNLLLELKLNGQLGRKSTIFKESMGRGFA